MYSVGVPRKIIGLFIAIVIVVFSFGLKGSAEDVDIPVVVETIVEVDDGYEESFDLVEIEETPSLLEDAGGDLLLTETLLETDEGDHILHFTSKSAENNQYLVQEVPKITETIIEGEGVIISSGSDLGNFIQELPLLTETIVEGEGVLLNTGDQGIIQIGEEPDLSEFTWSECASSTKCLYNKDFATLAVGNKKIAIENKKDLGGNLREIRTLEPIVLQDTKLGVQVEIPISTQIIAPKKQNIEIVEENNSFENAREENLELFEDSIGEFTQENVESFESFVEEEFVEEIFENSLGEGLKVPDLVLDQESENIVLTEKIALGDLDGALKLAVEAESGVVDGLDLKESKQSVLESEQQLLSASLDFFAEKDILSTKKIELTEVLESGIGKRMLKKVVSFFDINDHHEEGVLSGDSQEFVDNEELEPIALSNQFDFGFVDQHVVFSKPVKITIDVSGISEEMQIKLLVKHLGDTEFSDQGIAVDPQAQCLENGEVSIPSNHATIQDGKAVFYTCGASTFARGEVPQFPGIKPNATVNVVVDVRKSLQDWGYVRAEEKFIIGGEFTAVGTTARSRIAMFNADKTLDLSFNPNVNNKINTIALQKNDGKILLGGTFTSVDGAIRNRIARLDDDGNLDTDFSPSIGGEVTTIVVQPDGKILVGGSFTSAGGSTRNRIARFNANGTLDTDFSPSIGGEVTTIVVQPDGKILVGGSFTTIAGSGRNRIARLNTNGTLDTGFNPNVRNGIVNTIAIQSDGKILVGGTFTSVGNPSAQTRNRIARFNADGTLDTGFNPNANGAVNDIYLIDENIFVGGAFTSIGGASINRLAKLNISGSLDTSFNPNVGNGAVLGITNDSFSNLIIGGSFTQVDGHTNNSYLTRVGGGINPSLVDKALWIQSTTGLNCYSHNCNINSRVDQSSVNRTIAIMTGTAGYLRYDNQTLINFNPTIHLNSAQLAFDEQDFDNYTVSMVFKATDIGTEPRLFNGGAAYFSFAMVRHLIPDGVHGMSLDGVPYYSYPDVLTERDTRQILTHGGSNTVKYDIATQTPWVFAIGPPWPLLRTPTLRLQHFSSLHNDFKGDFNIAEIMVFPGQLSTKEKNLRDSYLAIKYGFTLNQMGGGQNYHLSSELLARSYASGGAYHKNIAGIARDDATGLLQNKSQSLSDTGDIIIEATIPLLNQRTLIWGHNDADRNSWSSSGVDTSLLEGKVARNRYFQEKLGDIGAVKIAIPATSLPSYGENKEIVLLINTDENFTSGLTVVTGSLISGSFEFIANIPDGSYLSFGLQDIVVPPLNDENIALWMRSDYGTSCSSSGCNLTTWNDQSTYSRHATISHGGGGIVKYDANSQINFNPTINITNSALNFANSTTLSDYTMYYVLKAKDTGKNTVLLSGGNTSINFSMGSPRAPGFIINGLPIYANLFSSTYNTRQLVTFGINAAGDASLVVHLPDIKQSQIASGLPTSNLTLSNFSSTSASVAGDINLAEILVFAGELSLLKKRMRDSYLAIKYGLTLDQSTGGANYYLSDDTLVWSFASGGSYNKNIAGLARDDATSLYQIKSQSLANTVDLIVEKLGSLANKTSLIRSNNGGGITSWTTNGIDITQVEGKVARNRYFQEKLGDIAEVLIKIPLSGLPFYSTEGSGGVVALIDGDGDFSSGAIVVEGDIVDGFFEFVTNIPDGAYLSFGLQADFISSLDKENIALWMRSDLGTNCSTSDCNVTSWLDHSGKDKHASVTIGGGGKVKYDTNNQINFNPTINILNSRLNFANNITSYSDYIVYYMLKGDHNNAHASLLAGGDTTFWFSLWRDNKRTAGVSFAGIDTYSPVILTLPNVWQLHYARFDDIARYIYLQRQTPRDILADSGPIGGYVSQLELSSFSSSSAYPANYHVAEILVLSGSLASGEKSLRDSYFALKYGLTLDQSGGGQNYYLSDESLAWSFDHAGSYNKNIAGIARDDKILLNQTKSQSLGNTGDLLVEKVGVLGNKKSLIRGNNGGTTGSWTTVGINPTQIMGKVARNRYFQEKLGDVGEVTIRIPTTSLPSYDAGADEMIVLLIDADGNFSNGAITVEGTIVDDSYEFVQNISNGSYLSFAKMKRQDGDVSIEAPSSFALGSKTSASSQQTLEIVSDYFSLEDLRGSMSGYYSTISISALTGTYKSISSSDIEWKAASISLLSGTSNSGVVLGATMNDYHIANGVDILIKRDNGVGGGVYGKYATKLSIKLKIPAYTPAGLYTGTITYTLYPN